LIVSYNEKQILKALIDSILKSRYKNFEIIVVDNASTDGTKELLNKKYPKVKVVENETNLAYSGINSGIKYCSGKYILFLNNDMVIDKNCISALVKSIESSSSVGMAAPKLVNYYDRKLVSGGTWLSRAFYNGHIKGNNRSSKMIIPYLGVGLIRKSIVDEYGYLFDPDYFIYGEDVDLGLRIRLLGKEILFVNDALLYHMHAVTSIKHIKSLKMTYLMERNLLTSFFKNLLLSRIFLYFPYMLLLRIVAMGRDIVLFNFGGFFARLKAILWVVVNFFKILSKRRETQVHRKAATRFILEIFSEKYLYKKKFIV
jgi:GT2 family glycosyltransferase